MKNLWENQWALHCPHYCDGQLVVNLQEFGGPDYMLRLQPGPGFGDLSHPTTRLALKMLLPLVKDRTIIDVGCGSGILALAAAAAGAKSVYACDIDKEALMHGQKNAALNTLKISWGSPEEILFKGEALGVMNMIRSEQKIAWESLRSLHSNITFWITSGVLCEEKEIYLKEAQGRGWSLQNSVEEAGWLGFRFVV